ncbi:hypothetical protein HDV02_001971 [Globomyces sp. JEL0801]|nr:hypothetical protein HDV02_001971 [Globomyces sp. JEL0801]
MDSLEQLKKDFLTEMQEELCEYKKSFEVDKTKKSGFDDGKFDIIPKINETVQSKEMTTHFKLNSQNQPTNHHIGNANLHQKVKKIEPKSIIKQERTRAILKKNIENIPVVRTTRKSVYGSNQPYIASKPKQTLQSMEHYEMISKNINQILNSSIDRKLNETVFEDLKLNQDIPLKPKYNMITQHNTIHSLKNNRNKYIQTMSFNDPPLIVFPVTNVSPIKTEKSTVIDASPIREIEQNIDLPKEFIQENSKPLAPLSKTTILTTVHTDSKPIDTTTISISSTETETITKTDTTNEVNLPNFFTRLGLTSPDEDYSLLKQQEILEKRVDEPNSEKSQETGIIPVQANEPEQESNTVENDSKELKEISIQTDFVGIGLINDDSTSSNENISPNNEHMGKKASEELGLEIVEQNSVSLQTEILESDSSCINIKDEYDYDMKENDRLTIISFNSNPNMHVRAQTANVRGRRQSFAAMNRELESVSIGSLSTTDYTYPNHVQDDDINFSKRAMTAPAPSDQKIPLKSILKKRTPIIPVNQSRPDTASSVSSNISGYASAFIKNPTFHIDPRLFKQFEKSREYRRSKKNSKARVEQRMAKTPPLPEVYPNPSYDYEPMQLPYPYYANPTIPTYPPYMGDPNFIYPFLPPNDYYPIEYYNPYEYLQEPEYFIIPTETILNPTSLPNQTQKRTKRPDNKVAPKHVIPKPRTTKAMDLRMQTKRHAKDSLSKNPKGRFRQMYANDIQNMQSLSDDRWADGNA